MATKKAVTKRASNVTARAPEDRRWEAQDALRTIQRAQEIQLNKSLMNMVKREAQAQMSALAKVTK